MGEKNFFSLNCLQRRDNTFIINIHYIIIIMNKVNEKNSKQFDNIVVNMNKAIKLVNLNRIFVESLVLLSVDMLSRCCT